LFAECVSETKIENRSLIGEDMDKSKVARFLWPTLYFDFSRDGSLPISLSVLRAPAEIKICKVEYKQLRGSIYQSLFCMQQYNTLMQWDVINVG